MEVNYPLQPPRVLMAAVCDAAVGLYGIFSQSQKPFASF